MHEVYFFGYVFIRQLKIKLVTVPDNFNFILTQFLFRISGYELRVSSFRFHTSTSLSARVSGFRLLPCSQALRLSGSPLLPITPSPFPLFTFYFVLWTKNSLHPIRQLPTSSINILSPAFPYVYNYIFTFKEFHKFLCLLFC